MVPAQTSIVPFYLAVAPPDIAAVKFAFESYEGVGIVRTLDRSAAVVVVMVVPDCVAAADHIVAWLEGAFGVRRVAAPPEAADDPLLREA